jgi:hypothetical protein
VDAGSVNHGVVRCQRGELQLDAPGASGGSGQGTLPGSSAPAAGTTGYYVDASGVFYAEGDFS